mgnify:CR=1 FL=1
MAKAVRRYLPFLLVALALMLLPWLGLNPFYTHLGINLGIYVILAISMDLLVGFSGQTSLGHAAFYALGAYASGLLAVRLGFPVWLSIPCAAVIGAVITGLLGMPLMRVSGFYLAMLTIAFDLLTMTLIDQWPALTGGVNGLYNIPSPTMGNFFVLGARLNHRGYYYVVWVLAALAFIFQRRFVNSFMGRALVAIEGSPLAASAMGINVARYRWTTFVLSGTLAAIAGSLFGHNVGYLNSAAFHGVSNMVLAMALVGGLRYPAGPFIGALIFVLVPQWLNQWGLGDKQGLVYGLILMSSLVLLPKGLASFISKRPQLLRLDPADVPADGVENLERVVSYAHSGDEPPVLRLEKVSIHFGGNVALQDVDLEVRPGETHALIGPNGAGKTTLINIISGIYTPTSGETYFDGERTTGLPPHVLTQRGMVRTFQNLKIFPNLTVLENVMIGAHPTFKHAALASVLPLKALDEEEREAMAAAREVLAFLGLSEHENTIATELPYGTQKMVELARAIVAKPKLLLLDEPAAGLHNEELDRFEEVIRKLQQRGLTILIIEHHLDLVLRLADRVTVLNFGKRIFLGSPDEARADEQVKEVYIGGAAATA